jgi:hypothetical protein
MSKANVSKAKIWAACSDQTKAFIKLMIATFDAKPESIIVDEKR